MVVRKKILKCYRHTRVFELRNTPREGSSHEVDHVSLEKSCPLQIMEISTSNKFPYHGSVQKIGSGLPTNFHTMEVSKRLEKSWKFVGSRNDLHDLERKRFFQCDLLKDGDWLLKVQK